MTPAQRALELFDSLEPVDIDFMIGTWRGEGYPTGHAQDGLLEAYQWYGKVFESSEDVHPLLFSDSRGEKVSATMIYDQLPINDVFRKLDGVTVLGVMDNKIVKDPFFFKLTRENNN